MKMTKTLQSSLRRYSRYVLSSSVNVNFEANSVFDAEPCPLVKVYQPAGEDERAAIGFRQSENSTIEENAKEVLLLLDQYYNTSY